MPNLADCTRRVSAQQFSAQLPIRSLFSFLSLPFHMDNLSPQNQLNNKRKRDEDQTNSPSRSSLRASGSASPVPPNSADRPPSAPPFGHARRGRKKYVPVIPSHPNRFTSTIQPPSERQPVSALLLHEPPSIPHISNISQDNNQPGPPHLDLAAPGTVGPWNYDLNLDDSRRQPSTAWQGNDVSASPRSYNPAIPEAFLPHSYRSAPDSPVHRPPSPAPAIFRLQGMAEYVLQPSLINTSDISRPFNWSTTVNSS